VDGAEDPAGSVRKLKAQVARVSARA
jgi:hypothetical protein